LPNARRECGRTRRVPFRAHQLFATQDHVPPLKVFSRRASTTARNAVPSRRAPAPASGELQASLFGPRLSPGLPSLTVATSRSFRRSCQRGHATRATGQKRETTASGTETSRETVREFHFLDDACGGSACSVRAA